MFYGFCFCFGIWIILASQYELKCVPSPLSFLPCDSLPHFLKTFRRTGIDSFSDIWFTLWTALKWLKWVFIHLLSIYSDTLFLLESFSIVCVFVGVYIIELTYLVAKVVHRISYLFYFSKVCSDFSLFLNWLFISSLAFFFFFFPLISLVKDLSI